VPIRATPGPDNKVLIQMFKVLAEIGSIVLGPNNAEVVRVREWASNPDLLTEMDNNPEAVENFKNDCF
jgi:hypothetical protein